MHVTDMNSESPNTPQPGAPAAGSILTVTCKSPDQTQKWGHNLGKSIEFPLVVALTGDLGSGKTVFVQGLARGLDVAEEYYITSPSFTLINAYPGRLPLYHADLYRLAGAVDTEEIGLEELMREDNGVVAIEWAERLDDQLPEEYLVVQLKIGSDDTRQLQFRAHGKKIAPLVEKLETLC